MADFSKQWAMENDPEFPWDFDILEVFSKLKPNTYENWICEGYGFAAIGNLNGQCMLLMPTEDLAHGIWTPYEKVVS